MDIRHRSNGERSPGRLPGLAQTTFLHLLCVGEECGQGGHGAVLHGAGGQGRGHLLPVIQVHIVVSEAVVVIVTSVKSQSGLQLHHLTS